MLKDPFKFTVAGLDFNFKFESKSISSGYSLFVDETPFDDLAEFKEVVQVPKVAHSVKEEFQGANTQRIDFFPLLEGILTPISVEFNMRSAQVTLDVDGKPEKSWNASSLIGPFDE